jgi:hypothetical protein
MKHSQVVIGGIKKPFTQQELLERCGKGEQWCHECKKFDCGDNTHPDKPKK